jgi:hypothetical protein
MRENDTPITVTLPVVTTEGLNRLRFVKPVYGTEVANLIGAT